MTKAPVSVTSGDPVADRRYVWAIDHAAHGDLSAAADILVQVIERVPNFGAAWFALGAIRDMLGNRDGAAAAFEEGRRMQVGDDRYRRLRLARLGAASGNATMSAVYIRRLFQHYASRPDRGRSRGPDYRGPALLFEAVRAECRAAGRPMQFAAMLDLRCGPGLSGVAFRPAVDRMVGVDLLPAMIQAAGRKGIYDLLKVDDMFEFMAAEADSAFDLVIAADVFSYLAELETVAFEVARLLRRGGCLALTVETHEGAGAILLESLRFAHAPDAVKAALAKAGLTILRLDKVSYPRETGIQVPGLLAIAICTERPVRSDDAQDLFATAKDEWDD